MAFRRARLRRAKLVVLSVAVLTSLVAAPSAAAPEPVSQQPIGEGLTFSEEPTPTATTEVSILAAQLPTGFTETNVFSGLSFPTMIRFSPDGRVFITEKGGRLKVYNGLDDPTPDTVIDLTSVVHGFWDRGLLGLALHPNFPATPYVYLFYTWDTEGYGSGCPTPPGATTDGCMANGRFSRIQVNASNQAVGGEQVILSGNWCQQYPSHATGSIEFAPDGSLYVSAGDGAAFNFADYGQGGGSLANTPTPRNPCGDPPVPIGGTPTPPTAEGGALRSQDLRTSGDPVTFDGTILRINADTGAAATGNPLIGGDAQDDRIIAYGLRNPFRITTRPGTNELWVGDVGWYIREEINRIISPTAQVHNFGWPCYEGTPRQPDYDALNLNICENLYAAGSGAVTAPFYQYLHGSPVAGCGSNNDSVTGLAFYTGTSYPTQFRNGLFFADYSRGCIWVMHPDANGLPNPSNVTLFASSIGAVGLQAGPNGDIFAVNHLAGTIVRYSFPGGGGNQPPVAQISANPTSGTAPLTVNFSGTGSSDPDGDPLTYSWDLNGDGVFGDSTSPTTSFTYSTEGTRVVSLRVSDGKGGTNTAQVTIQVGGTGGSTAGYVQLPGTSGALITTPDSAGLSITGDIDIRVAARVDRASQAVWEGLYVKGDINQAGGEVFFAKRSSPTTSAVFSFRNSAGTRFDQSSNSGYFTTGDRWYRVTLDVDNGSGGRTVTFYYSNDPVTTSPDSVNWTVHSTHTTTGVANIADGTNPVILGNGPSTNADPMQGRIYYAEVRSGIGGTRRANPDFRTTTQLTTTPPNYSGWRDSSNNNWTIQGSGWTYVAS